MKRIAIALICIISQNACSSVGVLQNVISNGPHSDHLVADSIEARKSKMLSVADSIGGFIFSRDPELFEKDSHAYWLMNRMMQMVQMVDSAEDGWAWALAMNDCVDKYNEWLGRRAGSAKTATLAIEELINIYSAGNQPEMNTYTYVISILEIYRTIHRYQRLIGQVDGEGNLDELCYREYKAWFDLNNALNGIMHFHTYALATYSALSMDLNYTFGYWSEMRCEELDIESNILQSWNWKPYKSNSRKISERKFDKLVMSFKNLDKEDIIDDIMEYWAEKDYIYAGEKYDEYYDEGKAAEMFRLYGDALVQWRNARKDIEASLPKKKRKSYSEITEHIHTRLYSDLSDLKDIQY